jgi:hypothetical protein
VVGGQACRVEAGVVAAEGDVAGGVLGGAGEGLRAADGLLDALDEVDVEGGGQAGEGGLVVSGPAEERDVRSGLAECAQSSVAVGDGQVLCGPAFGEGAGEAVELADLLVEGDDEAADAGGGAVPGP